MIKISDIRRIQFAVQHKDPMELQWAASFCKARVNIASGPHQVKVWGLYERMVSEAMADSSKGYLDERAAA